MNFLAELRFSCLSYVSVCKTYDSTVALFRDQLISGDIKYSRLDVFFSKNRIVIWLRLGQVDREHIHAQLAQVLTVLLTHYRECLPDAWDKFQGLTAFFDSEILTQQNELQVQSKTKVNGTEFEVRDAQHYWREMSRRGVILDNGQRERVIREMLSQAAEQAGGGLIIPSSIMNEVVVGAEKPQLSIIQISPRLLGLPEKLLITILKRNLCFAMESGGDIAAKAFYIGNGGNAPNIEHQLLEALHLYQHDVAQSIAQRQQQLQNVVYLEGLGSYQDKQKRLDKITSTIADSIDAGDQVCNVARQASALAKIDLPTSICKEYPEFLGHMGGIIAKNNGAEDMVVTAIVEHWWPGQQFNQLPHTLVGALLGIADRLDDICGHYYQAEFKLSHLRDVKAWFDQIIEIVGSVPLDVSMRRMLKFSLSLYESQGLVPWREKDLANLLKVFGDRLYYYLLGQEYTKTVAEALTILEVDNVYTTMLKARLLTDPDLIQEVDKCTEACKTLERVCAKDYKYEEAAREFLEQPEEKDLFEVYLVSCDEIRDSSEARDYEDVLYRLAKLAKPLMRCINAVDLDTQDQPVRYNRLSLLAEIRVLFHVFADFSLL